MPMMIATKTTPEINREIAHQSENLTSGNTVEPVTPSVTPRVSFDERPPTILTPKKRKKRALSPIKQIIQPILQAPIFKGERPRPPHEPRKRGSSGGSFASPESFLSADINIKKEHEVKLDELISHFDYMSNLLEEKLPDRHERIQMQATVQSLSEAISKISDKDISQEISQLVNKLKNDVQRSASEALPTKQGLGMVALSAAILFFIWNPSKKTAVAVGIALGYTIMTTDLMKHQKIIFSLLGLLSIIGIEYYCNLETIDEVDPVDVAVPEMDINDMNKSIGALTSMIAVYISTVSGKNIPTEMFRNFGNLGKVKTSISEAVTAVLSYIESIYNWLRHKLFDLPSSRFFHTASAKVTDFCTLADDIHERERVGDFHRIQENYNKLSGVVTDGELLKTQIPRDSNSSGAIEVLTKTLNNLNKIKTDFERHNLSNSGGRQEAVGVVLKGAPGIGKSVTMEHLTRSILATVLSDTEYKVFLAKPSTFIFNRQFENKYWDGYDSNKVICMFDDLMQARDIAGNPDGEAMNIIRSGSAFEMNMHCAEMSAKGVTTFQSKFILATTNMEQLRSESIISSEALNRRFDFHVVVVPKPAFCTKETRKLGHMARRLDYSKLPKTTIKDKGHYKPGQVDVTNLNPDVQDFYLCTSDDGKQYNITGQPISFQELTQKILDCYVFKRQQFIAQSKQFERTAEKWRRETRADPELAEPQSIDIGEMDLGEPEIPLQMEPIHENEEEDEAFFDADEEYHEPVTPGEVHIQAFREDPPKFTYRTGDPEFLQALRKTAETGIVKYEIEFAERAVSGYEPHIQTLVRKMCERFWTFKLAERYVTGNALNDLFESYFETKDYTLPPVIKLAEMVDYLGLDFINAFMSKRLSEYPRAGWGMGRTYVPKAPKNKYINYTRELKSYVYKAAEEYGHKASACPTISWLKRILAAKPYVSALLIFVGGGMMYKLFSKAAAYLFSFASPESFGHSDKMKKGATPKTTFKNAQALKNSLGIQATAQSGGLDANGVSIADSIGKRRIYEFLVETNFGTGDMDKMGYVIMLSGRIGILPYHFIAAMASCCTENQHFLKAKVKLQRPNSGHAYEFTVEEIIAGHQTGALQSVDAVLVEFPRNMQPTRNGVEYFAKREDYGRISQNIPFMLYFGNRGGHAATHYGYATARDKELHVSDKRIGTYQVRQAYAYDACTDKGDCGAPFFALNSAIAKRKIFGFHVAGNGQLSESYSAALCQEDLLEDLKLFDEQIEIEEDPTDVHPQSNLEPFSNGQFDEIGLVVPAPSRNYRSAIVPSKLWEDWTDSLTRPALLKSVVVQNVLIDPRAIAHSKYCFPPVWFDQSLIDKCRDEYYAHIVHIHTHRYDKRLLTIEEAINGVETEVDSHGIASGTSAGYPMNVQGYVNRKAYLFEHGRESPEFFERLKEITAEIEQVEAKYKRGIRPAWFFTDCLKDERRPHSKVDVGSTRMFSGCPFYYLVIFKRYFGSFILESVANRVRNGSAVGMNPYSSEWNALAENLRKFDAVGSQVGAGDYAAFDGSEKPRIHYATLDIINRWYSDSEENQKIRKILWLDLVNSRHILDGVAYDWSSSLPSGHPFTIWANNMYNEMAFLMCWVKMGNRLDKFYDNVYLCKCGDDNIFTVHPDYRENFNEMTLCAPMKELGLTYTTETKGDAVYPFRNLEDVEFLKRSFRKEARTGLWVAPLRLNVVLEIPFWTKRTSEKHAIAVSNVIESLKELSLHSQEVYNKWAPLIIAGCIREYPGVTPPKPLEQSYYARQAETCDQICFF